MISNKTEKERKKWIQLYNIDKTEEVRKILKEIKVLFNYSCRIDDLVK